MEGQVSVGTAALGRPAECSSAISCVIRLPPSMSQKGNFPVSKLC